MLPSLIPADADLSLTTVPRYYDGQLRVDYDLDRWGLAFGTIGSDDVLELFADNELDPVARFYNRTRFVRVTADARYHDGPWSANLALSPRIQQLVFEPGATSASTVAEGSAARRAHPPPPPRRAARRGVAGRRRDRRRPARLTSRCRRSAARASR